MSRNSFGALGRLDVADRSYEIFRLGALADRFPLERLPFSLKILLENLLRHEDGVTVGTDAVEALAGWQPGAVSDREIAFAPARILMQDFTGVPCVADLAAMRDAMAELGGDPAKVNPLVPAELVIDHSVSVDYFGTGQALARNGELEYQRNRERYEFLRWGQAAFDNFRVVPPNTGICHQVNLEYLSRVVFVDEASGRAYPDTLVGTDSHTPMVNGLGVLGWGVGGIEAEAAMLGQPIPMLIPSVVGFKLVGEMPEGSTATDLVLTVTERLRHHGVVGKFVEFYGPGVAHVPLANRATIGNMSPEYGSTVTMFPIDAETLRYLDFTGRPAGLIRLVEAYAREQGMWRDGSTPDPLFSETLELDLATVVPSLAGPRRPQDRVALDRAKEGFRAALAASLPVPAAGPAPASGPVSPAVGVAVAGVPGVAGASVRLPMDEASAMSFPASDPPAAAEGVTGVGLPDPELPAPPPAPTADRPRSPVPVRLADGSAFDLDHGHVVIAAITSCTNTSNPYVMLAAGLLARNAVERGLEVKPWVKTSLAPGSKVVSDYFDRAGLTPYLDKLHFNLVGYGCTTCIGNSGPLPPEVSAAVEEGGLAVCAVLSGNRNFEGRINPDVRMNYLASPPLVVAYALAGSMDVDLRTEPLGEGTDGPVYLRDIWPGSAEIDAAVADAVASDMFRSNYGEVFAGDERWQSIAVPGGDRFAWDGDSTYVRMPPYFEGMPPSPGPLSDVVGARALARLGDSITTDHISPAGSIRNGSPAAQWLTEHGVQASDFNSYGSRRGNHEVMIRGTFANNRLRNQLAPGTEGGVTVHLPDGEQGTIYDVATAYQAEGVPLVVLAGKEYGSGSSRDWAAKGTALLGVRAVLAESYERIHRSNLIGMGILPLEFLPGESVASLGLTGREVYDITGLEGLDDGAALPAELTVRADGREFRARLRIDTPKEAEYYRHGGILP
ncbi:MAG TPA: aconitate hydratase, partial [Acidimicrobiales bacterium]|nr:aconitate hydratase [Acidimicrobiales bacterium]